MNADAIIIDGYVDEPACFGVPPYISPYIRTIAGVLEEHRYRARYVTIDQLRTDPSLMSSIGTAGLAVMIAGVTVPGKYLGGKPATLIEIEQIGRLLRRTRCMIGGPIGFGYAPRGGQKAVKEAISGFDRLLPGSPAESLDAVLNDEEPDGIPDYARSDLWSVAGSAIITRHPSYPHVMCELETARGCSRYAGGGCSFCTEPLYGRPVYRSIEGISAEVGSLARHGARHFRLGRQPDLLVYGAGTDEFPCPRPDLISELFMEIRCAAPDLDTLHIDNINPGSIARHPEESRAALQAIVDGHTPGDVAALGMETADPVVVRKNNLKAYPDEVMEAIRIINEVGSKRRNGIPELLPGLNFVIGLAGETLQTFDCNEQFLRNVIERGFLLRRINIRQLMPFAGTPAFDENTLGMHDSRFRTFKDYVRRSIDLPMLQRVFPVGTVLKNVIIEKTGYLSFGRQMGSYPILVAIPLKMEFFTVIDVVVVDWGSRSVTALPVPLDINRLPAGALKWIPGISRKKAGVIVAKRPFHSIKEFHALAGKTLIDAHLRI